MKKRNLFLPLATLSLLFSVGLAACTGGNNNSKPGGDGSQGESEPVSQGEATKITITAADGKTTIYLGQNVQLTASVDGVTWESKKPEVATVDASGKVTAVAEGSTVISASKEGCTTGSITIKVQLEQIKVTAADNKTSIEIDGTVQLSADKEGVTWKSSDETVATVTNGLVTGLKAGSATITASKDGFKAGSISIKVERPAALASLHWEDADHYSADGWWGTAAEGATPIYARTDGNASDAQCIAHMDAGDKETLTFTSSAAIKAELVVTMASSSSVSDLGAVISAKFNNQALTLGGAVELSSSSEFVEVSFGEVNLVAGNNVLELEFLASAPYLDNLNVHSKQQATIAVVAAPAKDTITPKEASMTAYIGEQTAIELTKPTSLEGVTYASDKESVATVSADGKVTGVALGTANITVKKDGMYSARIEVVVEKLVVQGEIRVEAENTANDLPSGFHKYTDRTQGITAGHSGSAYITGYDVSDACTLEYSFDSPKNQVMQLVIAGASHYQMSEAFSFKDDCVIKLNGTALTVNETAIIESNQAMGAPTVEVIIGNVQVVEGTNTFVIEFANRAPALDCFRFMPLS